MSELTNILRKNEGKKRVKRADFWRENSKHTGAKNHFFPIKSRKIQFFFFFNLIFGIKIQISELAINIHCSLRSLKKV